MDIEKMRSIIQMFEDSHISKMDLQDGDFKLILEKNILPVDVVQATQKQEGQEKPTGNALKSPLVGTFYQASGQDQEPFVQIGSEVQVGDTLCIIEAMKVMNEIKADQSGKILSIDVEDGSTVEFDQVLMTIG